MPSQPVRKRRFHGFLSHAHADSAAVDALARWLVQVAGLDIWYDATHLGAGVPIATHLADVIAESRSMLLALSQHSVRSGWVREEYEAAIAERSAHGDFAIIPIRLEECDVPGFLQTTRWIDAPGGRLTLPAANDLLASLHRHDDRTLPASAKDVFVSRGWRPREARLCDQVCRLVSRLGARLIGEASDQTSFGSGERVRNIMSSCSGHLAILCDRGPGGLSKYILQEIAIARELGLPQLIVGEPGMSPLPHDGLDTMISIDASSSGSAPDAPVAVLEQAAENLVDDLVPAQRPHYVFFATDFDEASRESNRAVKTLVERVAAMPCVVGDEIREGQIQQTILDRITRAHLMVADISDENLNSCIEAGMARAAGTPLYLVARGPRRRPPFMFRDLQVWHYDEPVELLGIVHRLLYPHRRRVLNPELS